MKTVIPVLCLLCITGGLGCAALSSYVTPATVDQKAVDYAVSAGVADSNDFQGFANLDKALRLEVAVESAYQVKILALNQIIEKNQLDYGILRGVVTNNVKAAQAREEQLFGETGLLSMGLSLLGVGGLGGVLGLMRKRPGDITPVEMESAMAGIKGTVTAKDRQFAELVKGVQSYLDANPGVIAKGLKAAITAARSSDTATAIATVKARLA